MPRSAGLRLSYALAAATVVAQIGYPLTSGTTRNDLTVATVLLFFATSITHAVVTRGLAFTGWLVGVAAGGGLLVEAVGVRTGVPFGDYVYADTLGVKLLGVPAVIPLAWAMMAYPALVVARRVSGSAVGGTLLAGLALASWDLFLDPQMVEAGHWRWRADGPTITGIPVTNYLGWLVVAVAMMAVLRAATGDAADGSRGDIVVPHAVYLWTYASSVLANLAFFHRPAVAVVGGLGMGAVVALSVHSLTRGRTTPTKHILAT